MEKYYFWVSDPVKKKLVGFRPFPAQKLQVSFQTCFILLSEYCARASARTGDRWEIVEIFAVHNVRPDVRELGDVRAHLISSRGEKRLMCFRERFSKKGPPYDWSKAARDSYW